LVQKVTTDIKPYVNILSKILFQAVLDEKSSSAKRAFAASCAIILKYASPSQAQKLIEETAALHLGERSSQISCAILLKNYASLAADVVSGYHATILPIIFFSRFGFLKYYFTISNLYILLSSYHQLLIVLNALLFVMACKLPQIYVH